MTAKAWVAIALAVGLLGAVAARIVWSAISNGNVATDRRNADATSPRETVAQEDGPKAKDVSGKSPFRRSCSVHAEGGVLSFDSEVEPSLAADPSNADVLIGVYQQDRWSYGQARGIVASVSHDGGETWRQVPLPLSLCAPHGLPFERAGDPWVSIGPDGTAYAIAAGDGIAATSSSDGGLSWKAPRLLDRSGAAYFADKPTITADPSQPGVAYAAWARILRRAGSPPIVADAMFSQTTDGGRTWSRATIVVPHTSESGAVSGQILVDPKRGTVYHLSNLEVGGVPSLDAPSRLLVQRSHDGGETWSKPSSVLTVHTVGYHPLNVQGDLVRTGVETPDFAIDPSSGTLFAVWQDARFSDGRYDEVAFSRSTDEGRTWSRPTKVGAGSDPAGVPVIDVNRLGDVGVLYYDLRVMGSGSSRPIQAQAVIAVSHDGGRTFSTRSLSGRVDVRTAPRVFASNGLQGYFLGDYLGLAAYGSGFTALFALPNPDAGDPADIYLARIERD